MRSMTLIGFALPALVAGGLLAGCSGQPEEDAPPVASLQSADPAKSPAGKPDDQRPLVPVEATEEEREAVWKVWTDCITETGGPGYENPKMVYKYQSENDPKAERVLATCLPKEPESYEKRQQRTDNAAFRDNQREWYRCAKEAGYQLNPPDETGQFGLAEIGPLGDATSTGYENCRKAAFKD